MTKQLQKKNYLVKKNLMNNISDKNVVIVILVTILVVFAFIFSVKSPERKIIESPIMWRDDFSAISTDETETVELRNFIKKSIHKNYLL